MNSYNQEININNQIILIRKIDEYWSSGAFESDGEPRLYRSVATNWSIYDKREKTEWLRVPQSLLEDLEDLCSDEDKMNNIPFLSELLKYYVSEDEHQLFLKHNGMILSQ